MVSPAPGAYAAIIKYNIDKYHGVIGSDIVESDYYITLTSSDKEMVGLGYLVHVDRLKIKGGSIKVFKYTTALPMLKNDLQDAWVEVYEGSYSDRLSKENFVEPISEEDHLEEIMLNQQYVNTEADNIERSIAVMESLVTLRDELKTRTSISTEDNRLINIARSFAVAGTKTDGVKVIPAMESFNDSNLAIESISETIGNGLKGTARSIGNVIKKIADEAQGNYTLIQFQDNRSESLRKRLNDLKSKGKAKPVSITVGVNKNLRYGHNGTTVKTIDDYIKHLTVAKDMSTHILEHTTKFAEDDLFSSLKTFISPLTGYDKNFKKMFLQFSDYAITLSKLKGMVKDSSDAIDGDEYISDVLLGLSHLEVSVANSRNYTTSDIDSMKTEYGNFYVTFVRNDKFSTTTFNSDIDLDNVTIKHLETLLDLADEQIKATRRFNTLSVYLSKLGAGNVFGSQIANILTLDVLTGILQLMLASYRLMLRMSVSLYNTGNSVFNYTRGNTGKVLSIVDQALSEMEHTNKFK